MDWTSNQDVARIEPSGPPRGEISVRGAKNSALPLIAAALLVEEGTTEIDRVPFVKDVEIFFEIIRGLGVRVEEDRGRERVTIDASRLDSDTPDGRLVGELRGSLMLLAPLLARLGSVRMARPGGCSIGVRNFDLHLAGLRALGAEIREDGPVIEAVCRTLVGAPILLGSPTHTGTQQLILAATRARGTTIIANASQEPEVHGLCRGLTAMGAEIDGSGTSRIVIHGVGRLRGTTVTCRPSRLETSFFAMIGCLPGGRLTIRGAAAEAEPVLITLGQMGACLRAPARGILDVVAPATLRPCRVMTWPYPGFPTDAQPHLLALACFAKGRSSIRETLYEDRFRHVEPLRRMGANILVDRHEAVVFGPSRMSGTEVEATDLQAGAALVLAALGSEGPTSIRHFSHVLRGYPDLLRRLGEICGLAEVAA